MTPYPSIPFPSMLMVAVLREYEVIIQCGRVHITPKKIKGYYSPSVFNKPCEIFNLSVYGDSIILNNLNCYIKYRNIGMWYIRQGMTFPIQISLEKIQYLEEWEIGIAETPSVFYGEQDKPYVLTVMWNLRIIGDRIPSADQMEI